MKNNSEIIGILIRPNFPSCKNTVMDYHYAYVSATLYRWAGDLLRSLDKKQIIDIKEQSANRQYIEKLLIKFSKITTLFYGHGDEEKHFLYGFDHERVLTLNNIKLLKGSKIFVCACCTELFAQSCINEGTSNYIGYKEIENDKGKKESLKVPIKKNKENGDNVSTEIDNCFKAPNNLGALELLKNNLSAKKIYEKMLKEYDNSHNKLVNIKNLGLRDLLLLDAALDLNKHLLILK